MWGAIGVKGLHNEFGKSEKHRTTRLYDMITDLIYL